MVYELLVFIGLSLSIAPWLWNGYTLLGYDSGFRLNGLDHIYSLLFSWNPNVNYGIDWTIYRAFALTQLPEAILFRITESLTLSQLITFMSLFILIGFSMYFFLRFVFHEKKYRYFWIFTSVFYTFNFLTLHWWLNAERASFTLYIALPLAMLIMYKQAFGGIRTWTGVVFFGLLYGLLNGGGSPPLFGATVIILTLAGILFACIIRRIYGLRHAARVTGIYLLNIISFLLFNAFWIIPLWAFAQSSFGSSVAAQGGIGGLIEWEKAFSSHASIGNLLRLQGFPEWYTPDHPYSALYLKNPILIISSILPVAVIIAGFLRFGVSKVKQKYILVFLLGLIPVGIFFTSGSHPPTGTVYILMMKYIPGVAVFRSSFFKFAPSLWLPIIILSGYYTHLFIENYIKNKTVQKWVWTGLIFGILIYHFPFFSTNSFAIPFGFSTRLKIPPYIYDLKTIIEKNTTVNDRILIMPDLDRGFINLPMDAYSWGFFSADILPRVMTNRSFLAGDANDDAVTRLIYTSLYEQDFNRFLKLMSLASVTHILWRGDVRQSDEESLSRPLAEMYQTVTGIPDLTVAGSSGPWILYNIHNSVRPMVYVSSPPLYTTGNQTADALLADTASVVRTSKKLPADQAFIIGAECIMCDTDEYTKFEKGIYLPPTDSLVKKGLKRIMRLNYGEKSQMTDGKSIDARLSRSLSLLSALITEHDEQMLKQYSDLLNEIHTIYKGLTGRAKIVYANRIYAYLLAMNRLTDGTNIDGEVAIVTQNLIYELEKEIYMADDTAYRYIVDLPFNGQYEVVSSNSDNTLTIDGQRLLTNKIFLKNGIHRIEAAKPDLYTAPYIFFRNVPSVTGTIKNVEFRRISPTHYEGSFKNTETGQYVLVFNQRFDPRWELSVKASGKSWQRMMEHVEANGFANAWILENPDITHFKITYSLHTYGVIGWSLTIVAYISTVIYFVLIKVRNHIK